MTPFFWNTCPVAGSRLRVLRQPVDALDRQRLQEGPPVGLAVDVVEQLRLAAGENRLPGEP